MAARNNTGKKRKDEPSFGEGLKVLNAGLKAGAFTHFYLLYGDQAYLRNFYRNQIRDTLMKSESGFSMGMGKDGGADSMNLAVFTGSDFTAKQVIDAADTLPFFAERRVIIREDTGLWNTRQMPSTESEALAEYFGSQPDTTYFILSEPAVDRTRKLYRALTKNRQDCTILRCEDIPQDMIAKWIVNLFRQAGKTIGSGVLAMLLSYTGEDMLHIRSEVEKLCAYTGDRAEIRPQDIQDVCTPVAQDRVFDMIEAIAEKRTDRALRIYADLLRLQTPPQVILALMERQYKTMMQVKDFGQSISDAEAAARLGMTTWFYSKYAAACRRYASAREIRDAYASCIRADALYKSGRIEDRVAVEMLITGAGF